MVTGDTRDLKVTLKFEKGSHTINNCKLDAADEAIYTFAAAVATLEKEPVEAIVKVVETNLIED